jgi:hypothetical protein
VLAVLAAGDERAIGIERYRAREWTGTGWRCDLAARDEELLLVVGVLFEFLVVSVVEHLEFFLDSIPVLFRNPKYHRVHHNIVRIIRTVKSVRRRFCEKIKGVHGQRFPQHPVKKGSSDAPFPPTYRTTTTVLLLLLHLLQHGLLFELDQVSPFGLAEAQPEFLDPFALLLTGITPELVLPLY